MGRYYKSKSEKKRVEIQEAAAPVIPEIKLEYVCPRCTRIAIQTSNKMLGVTVPCSSCGETITLDDENRYREIVK